MNGGAPTCPKCGGLAINPSEAQCRFCGTALAAYGAPPGYAAPGYAAPGPAYGAPPPPQGYGGPQAFQPPSQNYGAPPGYGAPPPQNYGAPPGYGQQPPGYGAPPGYGPPNPYGQPPQPYNPYAQQQGYPMAPVQGFGGGYGRQVNSGWASGWSTFLWVRLAIAGVFIMISLIGACVSAIAN